MDHSLLSLLKVFQEVRTAHGRPLGQKGLDWLQEKKGRVMPDSEQSQRPLLSEVGKGPGHTFPSSWGLDVSTEQFGLGGRPELFQ